MDNEELLARIDRRFTRVDDRFTAIDQRFTVLEEKLDKRFAALEKGMDARFEQVDTRFEQVDKRLDKLEEDGHQTRILVEATRGDVKLLAETVMHFSSGLDARVSALEKHKNG